MKNSIFLDLGFFKSKNTFVKKNHQTEIVFLVPFFKSLLLMHSTKLLFYKNYLQEALVFQKFHKTLAFIVTDIFIT